jgi:type VI secretion system protein ImpA
MPLNQESQMLINQRFKAQIGIDFDLMLKQINKKSKSGENLKFNGVYEKIKQARTADDPNLPQGDWKHDLKTADWGTVSTTAINALNTKTKDLQIAIWLLEAKIHQFGFAGVAPCVAYIQQMMEQFWADFYPQINKDDLAYRTNLIDSMNNKLQPCIRQIHITQSRTEQQYSWSDWEMAIHIDSINQDKKNQINEYPTKLNILQGISGTPIEFYQGLYQDLELGIEALTVLSDYLDEKCKEQSPSLLGIKELLVDIKETLAAQLKNRGLFSSSQGDDELDESEGGEQLTSSSPDNHNGGNHNGGNGQVKSREMAYAKLAEAADYLMQDDPHSPVPYLIYKAIEWGNLNTAQLYQELFVDYQGQLNIFEILGLDIQNKK